MTPKIRIGLLGASKIAPVAVITPAKENEHFVISAVGARDPDRARTYAQEHDIPGVAAGYAELVARDDVDVVYNALPPSGHVEWTLAALANGKAVLCEKPFAMNQAEARTMVEAARAANLVLLEAFHYRLHAVMRRAEALLKDGVLGRITRATGNFDVQLPKSRDELRWRADLGGGGLMDLGCYPLHAMRTLLGEPEVLSAEAVFDWDVDAVMRAQLRFPGDVSGEISCSMTTPKFSAILRVEGERGSMEITNFIAPQIGCRFTTTVDGVVTNHDASGPTTYAAQLQHLHDVLTGKCAALIGGDDAIANMGAIDAIYAAARAAR